MPEIQKSDVQTVLENLNERNKELNCIYKTDELLRQLTISLDDLFSQLKDFITQSYRYTEICRCSINFNEKEYISEGFRITDLMQKAEIRVDGKVAGSITVCYIKPLRLEKGVFLPEETRLLNTIAQKLSDYFDYRNLRESIEINKGATSDVLPEQDFITVKVKKWLSDLHLKPAEIEEITKVQIKFKKAEIICKQGAITSYIMILADGLTKNYLEGTQDRGFNFSIVKPIDFIGLSSLFNQTTYLFSGSAITPCTVFHIEKERFKNMIASNVEFASEIMKWYCRMTEGHLNRMSCLANKQALGRVADILLYLSEKIFDGNMIENIISRKDIAELAGMSTESAVRILSELNKDKIIKIVNKGIEISNPALLKKLSIAG